LVPPFFFFFFSMTAPAVSPPSLPLQIIWGQPTLTLSIAWIENRLPKHQLSYVYSCNVVSYFPCWDYITYV
jgi:hypothetical protein